jgi:hypothetical protein
MIGFPAPREEQAKHYDFIRKQTHDSDSQEWEFPAQYMFKGVPHYDRVDDPVGSLVGVVASNRDKRPNRRGKPADDGELKKQAQNALADLAHREKDSPRKKQREQISHGISPRN